MLPFTEDMIKHHGAVLLEKEMTASEREQLAQLLECLTNIDTEAKLKVFSDLVSVHSKIDYVKICEMIK